VRKFPRDRPQPKERNLGPDRFKKRSKPEFLKKVPEAETVSFVLESNSCGEFDVSSLSVFPFKIENTKKVGLKKWNPLRWKSNPGRVPGMGFKLSTRGWLDHSLPRERAVPFIDNLGRFSPNILGYWRTNDQTFVASLVATVYTRLRRLAVQRTKKKSWNRSLDIAYQAACYYVLTQNAWYMERCIALLAKNDAALRALTYGVVQKLGADTRFVLGQLLHQSSWLKSRAERPRVKPSYSAMARVDPWISRRPSPRIENGELIWRLISEKISVVFPVLNMPVTPTVARWRRSVI